MAYEDNREMGIGRLVRQTIIGSLLIVLAVVVCSVVMFVSIDAICARNIETALPFYPDAELVSQEYNFLRPRAMGQTYVVLESGDDFATVRQWYRDHRLQQSTRRAEDDSMRTSSGLATVSHRVAQDPVTGRTLIYLVSECAFN